MTEIVDGAMTTPAPVDPVVADDPAPMPESGRRRAKRQPVRTLIRTVSGIVAVGSKELRGRMRGRRAFVIVTVYLLLLAGFAWTYQQILAAEMTTGFGTSSNYASALLGQELFGGLLMLMTLLVVFLAPSFTAGAISLEREKQTLDMLVATPISSFAIVVGKLLSALTYVFLLIAASIPLTAIVFLYGGVAPDDVLRGYIVLFVTAIGLGAFGIFCSTLLKRTQAATVITTFGVLTVTLGSIFMLYFWNAVAGVPRDGAQPRGIGPINGQAPLVIAYLNPFLAQADIACATQVTPDSWCTRYAGLVNDQNGVVFFGTDNTGGGVIDVGMPVKGGGILAPAGGGAVVAIDRAVVPGDVVPFGVSRDTVWPKMVLTWLILAAVFLVVSVQLVAPTRRWRPRLPRRRATRIPS